MAQFDPETGHNGSAVASEAEIRGAVVGEVRGREVEIEQSAVRSVAAEEIEAEQSAFAFVRAKRVRMAESAAAVVVARTVEAADLRALFVLSPSVRGNVRTLFDLRTALAAGAGFFLARRMLRLVADSIRTASGWRRS